jgi:hypothetical protein
MMPSSQAPFDVATLGCYRLDGRGQRPQGVVPGSAKFEMNAPSDTYASSMQDQLNPDPPP